MNHSSGSRRSTTLTTIIIMFISWILGGGGGRGGSTRRSYWMTVQKAVPPILRARPGGGVLAFSTTTVVPSFFRSIRRNRQQLRLSQPLHASASSSSGSSSGGGGGRVSSAVQDADLLSKTTAKEPTKDKNNASAAAVRFDTNPPKGTRDFFPPDMRLRNWLFDTFRNVSKQYGFSEYDAPVMESESLYIRKAGEEVTQQLYNFADKGDRRVALRPEMTPSLARMVLKNKNPILPLKWFSIPQCWRYERMTRGRRREHYQWNCDIWGIPTVHAEAELLSMLVKFFTSVGLASDDVGIKVNSRLVIAQILTSLKIPQEKFAATCVLIDKLEKVPIDSLTDDLQQVGLERGTVEQLLDILTTTETIDQLRDKLGADAPAVQELSDLLDWCDMYQISDWIVFDASVVRGLSYYTGIVFEAFDRKGQLRAIAGGGRYNTLLETYGGPPTPAVGFGFGDAVIVELLKERDLLPDFNTNQDIDVVVFAMQPDYVSLAIKAATLLRQQEQRHVDVILDPTKKPKWVLKHADRTGASYCLIVGADEFANNQVSLKHMQSGKQGIIDVDALADWATATSFVQEEDEESSS